MYFDTERAHICVSAALCLCYIRLINCKYYSDNFLHNVDRAGVQRCCKINIVFFKKFKKLRVACMCCEETSSILLHSSRYIFILRAKINIMTLRATPTNLFLFRHTSLSNLSFFGGKTTTKQTISCCYRENWEG